MDKSFIRRGLNMYYYGQGKGKTTAVMGLAARAAGAGMNVCIIQFVKTKRKQPGQKRQSGEWPISSEIIYFESKDNAPGLGKIVTRQVGLGFVGILGDKKKRRQHINAARKGYSLAKKLIKSKKYALVILDELISALELKLLSEKNVLDLIKSKPNDLHLAYTGHDPFVRVIKASDLVSEIKMIKHPYYRGILAQRGIDF